MLKTVQFKRLHQSARLPTRAYNSAGYDVYPVVGGLICPGERKIISLGFATAFEPGYAAVVDDRGGIGNKGLTHLAGVIDADYRGEWMVIMLNTSNVSVCFSPDKAIAQILFLKVEEPVFEETTNELPTTLRADGKFGSSDKVR